MPEESKRINNSSLVSTRALDKMLRVQSKALAKIDRSFSKVNRVLDAATAHLRRVGWHV